MVSGPERNWLSVAEVADYLGIPYEFHTIRRLIRDGRLPPPVYFGPDPRWPWMDVVAFTYLASRLGPFNLELPDDLDE
jgi:hypothetical protein